MANLGDINAELLEALKEITDHLAAVMGGPIMEAGVKFQNDVEGIPTIVKARAVIAKAEGK